MLKSTWQQFYTKCVRSWEFIHPKVFIDPLLSTVSTTKDVFAPENNRNR